MSQTKKFSKRRFLWTLLRHLPQFLKDKLIRSFFEVDYTLPDDLVFKQAETVDEVTQALGLVYEAYLELNYISQSEARIRFNKFLALPSTVILIAKQNEEVIATLSIVPDSSMGLPSEVAWPITKYREQHQMLAEISALSIKKSYRSRRGRLLFSLCKYMFLYCRDILCDVS